MATSRILQTSYFGKPDYDVQHDNPYRALDEYLAENRAFGDERTLLLHSYPYSLAVELTKFSASEAKSYLEKNVAIETADKLFELASLNYMELGLRSRPLGEVITDRSYADFKPDMRAAVNRAYKLFLDTAQECYHAAKSNPLQADKFRTEGLWRYRMCLKLLTASLIRRLEGPVQYHKLLYCDKQYIQEQLNVMLGFFNRRALEK